jgi:hypothetical protein
VLPLPLPSGRGGETRVRRNIKGKGGDTRGLSPSNPQASWRITGDIAVVRETSGLGGGGKPLLPFMRVGGRFFHNNSQFPPIRSVQKYIGEKKGREGELVDGIGEAHCCPLW